MNKEVISIQGNLYQIIRTISEEQVNGNTEGLAAWKELLRGDKMFKQKGRYYIVREITDINIENE